MKIKLAFLLFFASLCQLLIAAEKVPSESQNLKKGKSFTLAVLPDTQVYCDTRLTLSKKWVNLDYFDLKPSK